MLFQVYTLLLRVYLLLRAKYNYFILNIRIYFTFKGRTKGKLLLPLPLPLPWGMPHPWWALLLQNHVSTWHDGSRSDSKKIQYEQSDNLSISKMDMPEPHSRSWTQTDMWTKIMGPISCFASQTSFWDGWPQGDSIYVHKDHGSHLPLRLPNIILRWPRVTVFMFTKCTHHDKSYLDVAPSTQTDWDCLHRGRWGRNHNGCVHPRDCYQRKACSRVVMVAWYAKIDSCQQLLILQRWRSSTGMKAA